MKGQSSRQNFQNLISSQDTRFAVSVLKDNVFVC